MSTDSEDYYDAYGEFDEDKEKIFEDKNIRLYLTPDHQVKQNRIESLKKSALSFDRPSKFPPFPHFSSLDSPTLEAPISESCTYPFIPSDHVNNVSAHRLSRTFPGRASFPPSTSVPQPYSALDDERSQTLQLINVFPSLNQHPTVQCLLPGSRPVPMSSAPEVNFRRQHQNTADYVKSWSLDTARYRPQLLNDQLHGLLASSRGPLPMEPLIDRSESSDLDASSLQQPQMDAGVQANFGMHHATVPGAYIHQATTTSDTLERQTTPYESTQINFPLARQVRSFATTLPGITVNPRSIEYRTRTISASSLQNTVDLDNADTERSETLRHPSLMSGVRRLQTAFRGAVNAVRSATKAKIFSPTEPSSDEDDEVIGNQGIRLRCSRKVKSHREFLQIKLVQKMDHEHYGAIWAMRSSHCGRLLATAGYDRNIRIWVLRQWHNHFKSMFPVTASPLQHDGDVSPHVAEHSMGPVEDIDIDSASMTSEALSTSRMDDDASSCSSSGPLETASGSERSRGEVSPSDLLLNSGMSTEVRRSHFYYPKPLLVYQGHEGVITELAWSKNLFLLSTGMDRQVRLWHISRSECLCVFSHNDTVPAIVFHPKDDRYFLSGSLDGKLRLWNIPDKKVRFWVDVPLPSSLPPPLFPSSSVRELTSPEPRTIITCATFACDSTKVVVGSYDGRVMFFNTELTYITFITVKSVSGRSRQCRVTAIEVHPTDSSKILVTSNDSRVRLVDARDYHTLCKYRGFLNETSQIRASFSATGRYIISGSENCFFYIWRKQMDFLNVSRFSSSRKDRNNGWEAIKAHDAVVTVAMFLPNPDLLLDKRLRRWNSVRRRDAVDNALRLKMASKVSTYWGEVIVSADCNGCIRVFKNRAPVASPPLPANIASGREDS